MEVSIKIGEDGRECIHIEPPLKAVAVFVTGDSKEFEVKELETATEFYVKGTR